MRPSKTIFFIPGNYNKKNLSSIVTVNRLGYARGPVQGRVVQPPTITHIPQFIRILNTIPCPTMF
jgi:hypothetical protein